MATCPCLRQQRSFCRRVTIPCDNDKAAGGPFNTATTGFRRRAILRCRNDCCRRNCNTLRQRKLESDAAPLRQILLQASYSTCRHDGTAVILDFRPRLANRCSAEVKTGIIPAAQGRSIMPRQGNAGWADADAGTDPSPAGRVGRGNPQHQAQKKESRLIAESGLSKRGSYLLSHLV